MHRRVLAVAIVVAAVAAACSTGSGEKDEAGTDCQIRVDTVCRDQDLRSVSMVAANLRGADFSGSDLTSSDFRDSDLTGAKFVGILFNGIVTGTTTNVNNNTVAAVSMTGVTGSGTTTASPFTAILLQEGNLISNGNTVGSQTATGSLVFSTTTTSTTDIYGIHNFTSNAWTSNNNSVGGISVTNLGASGTFLLVGIRAFTGSTVTWKVVIQCIRRSARLIWLVYRPQ